VTDPLSPVRGAAGVHELPPSARPEDVERAAAAAGRRFARADVSGAADKQAFLAALAAALRFPEWFGMNWDALADSLGELWHDEPAGGVLLVDGIDALEAAAPDDLAAAVDVFRDVAADRAARGPRVILLRRGGAPRGRGRSARRRPRR
jgi:hypothetical protein